MLPLVDGCETVEIPFINTTNLKYYFPENSILRDKFIVYAFINTVSSQQKSISNRALVNNTVLPKTFLTLVSKNKQFVNRFPLIMLSPSYSLQKIMINNFIDLTKCFLEISSIDDISASESFQVTFFYRNKSDISGDVNNYNIQNLTINEASKGDGTDILLNNPAIKIENINITIDVATKNRFYFPDNENLRDKKIIKIIKAVANVTLTPDGKTVISDYSYVTLTSKNQSVVSNLALNEILSFTNAIEIPVFNLLEVDFPKSYIYVPDNSGLVANEVFYLNVFYID